MTKDEELELQMALLEFKNADNPRDVEAACKYITKWINDRLAGSQ